MNTIGDAPIQPEYLEQMKDVARNIDHMFNADIRPKTVGFILMVFPFDDKGRCNYMSNADRVDVKIMLREQLARFEGSPDIQGNA